LSEEAATITVDPEARLTIRLAVEEDLRAIMEFLHPYGVPGGTVVARPEAIVHFNPLLHPQNYREVGVRYNLYNFTEEFVLLERDGGIEALMALKAPRHGGGLALEVNLWIFRRDCPAVAQMVDYAVSEVPRAALVRPTKLRLSLAADAPETPELTALLERLGFKLEYRGEDELGWDRPLLAYIKPVEPAAENSAEHGAA